MVLKDLKFILGGLSYSLIQKLSIDQFKIRKYTIMYQCIIQAHAGRKGSTWKTGKRKTRNKTKEQKRKIKRMIELTGKTDRQTDMQRERQIKLKCNVRIMKIGEWKFELAKLENTIDKDKGKDNEQERVKKKRERNNRVKEREK